LGAQHQRETEAVWVLMGIAFEGDGVLEGSMGRRALTVRTP